MEKGVKASRQKIWKGKKGKGIYTWEKNKEMTFKPCLRTSSILRNGGSVGYWSKGCEFKFQHQVPEQALELTSTAQLLVALDKIVSLIYAYLIYTLQYHWQWSNQSACSNRMSLIVIQWCFPTEMQYVWAFFPVQINIHEITSCIFQCLIHCSDLTSAPFKTPHWDFFSCQNPASSPTICNAVFVCLCVRSCAHVCETQRLDIDVLSASGRTVEWSGNSNRKLCCLFPHRPEYNMVLHFFPSV